MKLYFSPGACSLATRIVLLETNLPFTAVRVDLKTKQVEDGRDFNTINPKGYVPALEIDNGQVLTEGSAILQYIADQKPGSNLMPKAGSPERYRCIEWLTYVSTEIHKNMGALFHAAYPEEAKNIFRSNLSKRLDYISNHLKTNHFLMGETFSVADAYLFNVLSWSNVLNFDLTKWPSIMGYIERMRSRPHIVAALKAEGLL